MATHLFEITTTRDEVQVGFAGADPERAFEALLQAIAAADPVLLWHYAVARGAGGPEVRPVRRIAVFRRGLVRVSPVAATHPVVDLPA